MYLIIYINCTYTRSYILNLTFHADTAAIEAHLLLSDHQKAIINHPRKSLLFNDQETWIKRDLGLFQVTMGAYDGAEVSELVGNYLLYVYKISKLYEKKDKALLRQRTCAF